MKLFKILGAATLGIVLIGCKSESIANDKLQVLCTTTMITDLVKNIAQDKVDVVGLMGPGIDPHLYKASEGDVNKFYKADLIFYNGLHLEGKLTEVLDQMNRKNKTTVALAEGLDKTKLQGSAQFASSYDPHIWFNTLYWQQICAMVAKELQQLDPENADFYQKNAQQYTQELTDLTNELSEVIKELPKEQRILITAHDAFNYFGEQFGFEVLGLQGLSTAAEAGVKDVQQLAQLIQDKQVKAIFIETSVPKQTINALKAAVKAKGGSVKIGGELYSDALGDVNSPEGTYLGMYRSNVATIVNALK